MKGLKPCPFCGSEAEISINKTTQAQTSVITCSKCSCRKTLIKYPSYEGNIIEDAFEAWNTRKSIDKVIEQLEETFDKWGLDSDKKSIMREIVKKGGGNDYQTNPMKAVKTTSLPVKSKERR